MKAEFKDKTLTIGENRVELEYPIKELKVVANKIVVIYDPKSAPRYRQFNNCKAYDLNGNYLWTAEHPTNQSADVYIEFMKNKPLTLWNFACFVCELDIDTGKLVNARFTK